MGVDDAERYKVVTLKDIAIDRDTQKLTSFTQAVGQKMWDAGPFTYSESIQFTRAFLHELRRENGDPLYADFDTMPEDYKFTIYPNEGTIADKLL